MSRLCAGPIKIAKYENTQKITIDAKFYKYGMYKHENLASLLLEKHTVQIELLACEYSSSVLACEYSACEYSSSVLACEYSEYS